MVVISIVVLHVVPTATGGMATALAMLSPLVEAALQTGALVDVPGEVSTVPAGQVPHAVQLLWLLELVYVPAGHGVHETSLVAVPPWAT